MGRVPGKFQTVLVVDDQALNIAFVNGMLESQCMVISAGNGPEALHLAATHLPDLVLLDAQMPGMNGFEVCRRLKANPLTAAIPVIFLTAQSDEGSEAEGLKLGAIDYIGKPFNGPVLRARVRNHLELVRQRCVLERLAQQDGLTGIANRRAFDAGLQQQWARMALASRPLAVLMMDVDYFKAYNDAQGHLMGDQCLKQVAQALHGVAARGGLCARYGGEEFAYVLPEADAQGAHVVAERLREAVEMLSIPHPASDTAENVTLSVGCAAVIPVAGRDAGDLLALADQALYQAKHQGRNQVVSLLHT